MGQVVDGTRQMITPFPEEVEEAKRNPGGWVYRIARKFTASDRVPAEAVVGAWKVDSTGRISGDFIPNAKYDKVRWPS